MKKEIRKIDVKELIKDINEAVEENEIENAENLSLNMKRKKVAPEITYSMEFNSGCDFAIRKSGKRTSQILIFLISKGYFFIYNEVTDKKTVITEPNQIKQFFKTKTADEIVISDKVSFLTEGIRKDDLNEYFQFICPKEKAIQFILKRGYGSFLFQPMNNYNKYKINENIKSFYLLNPTLLLECLQKIERMVDGTSRTFDDINGKLSFIFGIFKGSTIDDARYAIDKILSSPIKTQNFDKADNIEYLIKTYNLDVKRFINYSLYDIKKQGFVSFGLFLIEYRDYLNMCMLYERRIKDKYPEKLKTAHKIIQAKMSESSEIQEVSDLFIDTMMEAEDFTYQNSYNDYAIVMPSKVEDMIEEGHYLGHCVASYCRKVANKDCLVVFMRHKKEKDVPYLTVEILPDHTVSQIEGMHKRSELTEDEIIFLHNWSKYKGLRITAENAKVHV